MIKAWLALFAGWLFAAGLVRADGSDTRFSQAISTAERNEAGINRLSSDQVAVLDALVRRDIAARAATTADPAAPASFSQRLTADERRIAGLGLLTATELPRLNALVERQESSGLAHILLAPPVYFSPASVLKSAETKKDREIHGSVTLSYGWGGGYSQKTGTMVMNYDDPDGRFSVTMSYSESQVKAPKGSDVYIADGPR